MRLRHFLILLLITVFFLAHPLANQAQEPSSESLDGDYVKDEILVKVKDRNTPFDNLFSRLRLRLSERLLDNFNFSGTLKERIEEKGLDKVYIVKLEQNEDVPTAITKLKQDPLVEYAEPNYIVHSSVIPNDPNFSKLWGLYNTGQTGGISGAHINAPPAWDSTHDSNIVVGIIDTGIDYNHEDLASNVWTNPGEIAGNGKDDDNNGFIDDIHGWDFANSDKDPIDDNGHGTHVAGTIGAIGNNGVGIVGVNWNVKMAALKFLNRYGSGTTANAVKAVLYANMMGFKITNNSWGGGGYTQSLYDAINAANNAGNLFVAAAGNSGNNTDSSANYPASYNLPNIISVAATDHKDNLASFSNYGGNSVDLGAPGVDIYSTVPKGSCSLCDSSGYDFLSGTSMATPHVSGVAALVWSADNGLSNLAIKDKILYSTDALSSLSGKTISGGRLNLHKALTQSYTAPTPTQVTPTPFYALNDSFEVSEWNGLWSEDNQRDWDRSRQRSIDGRYSAEVDGTTSDGALISKNIDLTGKTSAKVGFWWYIENSLDLGEYLAMDISTDNGSSWVEKARLRGNEDPENSWQNVSFNVESINQIRLRFRGKMNSSTEDADVDLVRVEAY
ncbi:MAG: hypothetical protein A3C27_02360 [Candidatus Levybacteria bacterium RIFCSPHIGHO2_02_FULL_39_36]|uniref:Uncharacterized protein n=1 Tax=Candidatus Gottesmanbacteria bacterium RIFCSPHIGHO2_01_FULL_39_10 TaxID=1798375 RepID=A0A1F5ZS68_9BACT|nr:MAG: hypothetical protein A2773_03650 [Candidatus Gottesmanbacteria bacterium RIFCSPHIGHO2_01_FULL_39_10]OGH27786.1 MAG: hypothetical protein A3C27_02360 [Candidatus Levybacteria bacterium RIFCSPHIGHO2_02_FULL_39_36]